MGDRQNHLIISTLNKSLLDYLHGQAISGFFDGEALSFVDRQPRY